VVKKEEPPAVVKKEEPPAVVKKEEPPAVVKKAYTNGALGMGSNGAEVKKLQQELIRMGYLQDGDDDGSFGNKTKKAIMSRQDVINGVLKKKGIKTQMKVDGVWGPESVRVTKIYRDSITDDDIADAKDNNAEDSAEQNGPKESEYDKNQRLEREKQAASGIERDAMIKKFAEENPTLKFDKDSLSFNDDGGPTHQLVQQDGKWEMMPNTSNAGRSVEKLSSQKVAPLDIRDTGANSSAVVKKEAPPLAVIKKEPPAVVDDDPEVFDVVSHQMVKKSELARMRADQKAVKASTGLDLTKSVEPKLDADGPPTEFKPNYYHKPLIPFLPKVPIQKVGEKFYWKDSSGQVVPWTGNVVDRSMLNPASIDGVIDDDGKELSFDKEENKVPVAKEPQQDRVTVLKPLAKPPLKAESIMSLASVVDELLNEAGTATMPMSNTDKKSVWQSTKDTVGKGVDAVANTIPQPVKDVATKVANNPVAKFAGKAAGPALTVLSAPTIATDTADAFRLSDKGDSVGSFLKGGQAALNTAALGTTAAMLAPPLTVPAGIATGALGLTSLGLAGAEAIRDKWFPYKGKETADVKAKSANEELNRVLTLTQYKVGK
jgi:peptidoglycan hydrolase-like protein with peptidoglycan-binding domain